MLAVIFFLLETILGEGKGDLKLTGNLGNVMKESASTALSYLQANARKYGIDPEEFGKNLFIYTYRKVLFLKMVRVPVLRCSLHWLLLLPAER